MKAPISFEQFAKNPVRALLFLVTLAVAYLYVDNRINYTSQIEAYQSRVIHLEGKVDELTIKLFKSDSLLGRTAGKLEILIQAQSEE